MRVAHVSTAHHPLDKRVFVREARILARRGWDVTCVGVVDKSVDSPQDGVTIIGIPRPARRAERFTKVWASVVRIVTEGNFDLVQFHDPDLLLAAPLWRARGIRVIYDVHEDLPRQMLSKGWIPAWLRPVLGWLAEKIEQNMARLALSGVVPATVTIQKRFTSIPTALVMNLPDLENFERPWKALHERPKRVVYVGILSKVRGVFEFVGAAQELANRGYQFTLAGYFDHPDTEAQARAHPGWKHIDFRGYLSPADLADLLAESRVGVVALHPIANYIESEPVKLFEYMAAGLTVVGSANQGWTRHIVDSRCGELVDPENTRSVAQGVERAMEASDQDERGVRAQAYIHKNHSLEREIDRLEALYKTILSH